MSDRKIIKEGFSEELVYYYVILSRRRKEINNLKDFLEINIAWISFEKTDIYNSLFFKEFLKILLMIKNLKL